MEQAIKCVIWDLDETIWNGVLLEDGRVELRSCLIPILEELDRRGILLSIASKNDRQHAMDFLRHFGIDHFFLYPQIGWQAKSVSVQTIVRELNIGIDTIAFVDDQSFERDEVASVHPQVLCIDAADVESLLELPRMMPRFITEDSRMRRQMMIEDGLRKQAEESFEGPQEEFLASLNMQLSINRAVADDLQRVEELTVRTHQLNSTGITFSYEELQLLIHSPAHLLLVTGLTDRYGTYGKMGLALVERGESIWTLKLLLMSCRVMSRGVGGILLQQIVQMALEHGVKLRAEFKSTDRNRMMYMTFKFAGFTEVGSEEGLTIFEYASMTAPAPPPYVKIEGPEVRL